MKNAGLLQLVNLVEGLQAAAIADAEGSVQTQSLGFEADVPCAVAAIGQMQLEELGRRLGAGRIRDWAVSASKSNLYVLRRGECIVVAVGERDDRPTKVTEQIASVLEDLALTP